MIATAAAPIERLFCFWEQIAEIADEFASYEEQIKKYCRGEMDETRVQKYRLHFGTYAQRQEGMQMQRIKIPGGFLTSDQLVRIAQSTRQSVRCWKDCHIATSMSFPVLRPNDV